MEHLREAWRYTERNACRLVKQPRATQRYEARIDYEERRIRKRLRELAKKHPGSGYRRMTRLLRREGMKINKKRVQRLWREEGLRMDEFTRECLALEVVRRMTARDVLAIACRRCEIHDRQLC